MTDNFASLIETVADETIRQQLQLALDLRDSTEVHRFLRKLDGRSGDLTVLLESLHAESRTHRFFWLTAAPARDALVTNLRLEKKYGGIWASEPSTVFVYRFDPGTFRAQLEDIVGRPLDPGVSALSGVFDPNVQLLTRRALAEPDCSALIGHRFPWFSSLPERPAADPDRARYDAALAAVALWAELVTTDERPYRAIQADQVGHADVDDLP
jgi:hypothetical protein